MGDLLLNYFALGIFLFGIVVLFYGITTMREMRYLISNTNSHMHALLRSSLPGLTRQPIHLRKTQFSDGCAGQARARRVGVFETWYKPPNHPNQGAYHVLVGVLLVAGFLLGGSAYAADLNGVWASQADACDKVFVKNGSTVSFAEDADMHGSGFIIAGNQIKGKIAICTIKSTKEDGDTVHMVASCATDIMLSNVQFSVRIVNANRIIRMYPGIAELDTSFERCLLK
jgi:hypothetical protein